ncbi:2-oxo-tetronate isomerase [Agrobacterium sp. Azo12]|uniref:2-oxo-tetronate isomerase n=1 Tax=Agrobacterium sp. Azo12 TaxID=3031129 RepID=UPI0023D7DA79|nr:2-oxo-tetronate isomerase [Agrobacterium sp. Azo12]MDO5898407.1 hydroxypyruvate isomerase [Agrobacterium sp. Azo12]
MPKFAANLSMLYTEHPFIQRFAAAAADGFKAVEYVSPYEETPEAVAAELKKNGLTQALFNLPAGDWAAGERGLACLPDRVAEFEVSVDTALAYAGVLDCHKLNCLAGIAPKDVAPDVLEETLVKNLRYAATRLADAGVTLVFEPINTRDIPGYYLTNTDHAERIIGRVNHPNLLIQYDFYHMQIMQGDIVRTFERLQSSIGHVQVADNPGRHEPGTGEINHDFIFKRLDALGYDGWVGCEYRPAGDTSQGLGWLKAYQ